MTYLYFSNDDDRSKDVQKTTPVKKRFVYWGAGMVAVLAVGLFLLFCQACSSHNSESTQGVASGGSYRGGHDYSAINNMLQQKKYEEALTFVAMEVDSTRKDSLVIVMDPNITGDELEYEMSLINERLDELKWLKFQALIGMNRLDEAQKLIVDCCLYAMGILADQPVEARAVLERILPLADEDTRQWIQKMLPVTWYFEGIEAQTEQNYHHAIPCMEKAQKGFHEVGDVENEMDAWIQIGDAKRMLYDAKGALDAYKQAEALAIALRNEVIQWVVLKGQLDSYELIGDSNSITEIKSKMSSLVENSESEELGFKNNIYLGDVAMSFGQTRLAEMYYLKNEDYINSLGDDYRGGYRFTFYLHLRDLYLRTDRLDDALRYLYLIRKELQGGGDKEDCFFHYQFLSNIYKRKHDSISCFRAMDTLFAYRDLYSEPHEAAQLYVVRGGCHDAFNDYESALSDYRKADELLAAKYDDSDPDRVELQLLMGGVESRLKHCKESEQLCRNYLEGTRRLVGEEHIDFIDALGYLANAEAFAGHVDMACNDYTLAVAKLKQQIKNKLPYLNPSQREGYWKSVSKLIWKMTSFALKAEQYQTAFTESCYNGLALSKNFLLASDRSAFDLIKNHGTEEDLNNFAAIIAMQAKVRELEKNADKNVDSILLLTSLISKKETQLAGRCRAFGDITAFANWDYQTVKGKLHKNDVLIDFADFLSVSDNQQHVYAAYVINREQKYPLLKRLFDESSIDSALLTHPDLFYDTMFSAEVYRLLWEPFKNDVNEGTTVYYVPSQLLFRVALESLLLPDGSLLGDHNRFVRLSSVRELAAFDDKLNLEIAHGSPDAVLYGGLQYDVEPAVMSDEAKNYYLPYALASRGGGARGDSTFYELPWSRIEVDSLARMLKNSGFSVSPYVGTKGTEESFLNLNGRAPRLLHIATHGFYYTPEKAKEVEFLCGYKDAMSLTGLVMSGGNAAWLRREIPAGVFGGILTANDIAQLDLSGVDMVVLSACHSGNGKATEEGLYGLQRAFKKAGVNTVVMSLWEINDKVGTEFMVSFYKSLLEGPSRGDIRKALNSAKSHIREIYPEPYFWAGFVALD